MPHTYKLAQFLCVGLLFAVGLMLPQSTSADVQIQAVVPGVCGNDIKEIGEQCDGSDLGGNSCSDLGYATGTLSCSQSCSFDVSACENPTPEPVIVRSSGTSLPPGRIQRTDETEITRVIYRGIGYPGSRIHLLLNGERLQSARTDDQGNFDITTHDLTPGFLTFSAVLESPSGESVQTDPVTIRLRSGDVSQISNVVVPPSINESISVRGNTLHVSGYAVPNTPINLVLSGEFAGQFITRSNSQGFWEGSVEIPDGVLGSVRLQASMLHEGKEYLSSVFETDISAAADADAPFGRVLPPDFNRDGRVNLVDFYILRFWFNRPHLTPPDYVDLNNDGVIDFADFSILAYYWTG